MFEYFYDKYLLTYSQGFSYRFALTVVVWGSWGLAISYLLYIISLMAKRLLKSKKDYNSVHSEGAFDIDLDSSLTDMRASLKAEQKQYSHSKFLIVDVLQFCAWASSWYGVLCYVFAPAILTGLHSISLAAGLFLSILVLFVRFVGMILWYCPAFLKASRNNNLPFSQQLWRRISITTNLYKLRFNLFFGFALVSTIGAHVFTAETCMNYFNVGYGYKYAGLGMSTRLTRYFELDTACPNGKICHLYATLPEETSTKVILNVHTGIDVSSIHIAYDKQGTRPLGKNMTAQSFRVDLEAKGERYVHSAFLANLEPNTKYTFEIYFDGKMQKNGTYWTLPTKALERNLKIASGGDVGTTMTARNMTKVLGKYQLDAIMVGGDLAYDNGMRACYYSWDLFINMFEGVNEQLGRLVPLIMSVGNHDIGYNALQDGVIDVTENIYYTYFPQESKVGKNGELLDQVPEIKERTTIQYHQVGNTIQLLLDSGYQVHYDKQVDYINNITKKFPDLVRMANFHVPIYPACYSGGYIATNEHSRKFWAPVFENNQYFAVFENHVHYYKKTYPIKNNTVVADGEGVVYFGDGNWGITPTGCANEPGSIDKYDYLEASSKMNHVWIMDIDAHKAVFYAVNKTNKIFDRKYQMNLPKYALPENHVLETK